RGGAAMAAPDAFKITVIGRGGHGSAPHETVDPIFVAAQVIVALQGISSRMIDPVKPFVISVCSIHSGTKSNIIPDEAVLEGTIRTLDEATRRKAVAKARDVAQTVARAFGASCNIEFIEDPYPITFNDVKVTREVAEILRTIEGRKVVEMDPTLGGEDFSRFLQKAPGTFYYLATRNKSKGCIYPNNSSKCKVDEHGISPSEVRYVIPAHVHLDHGGGTGYLLKKMPRAQVFAHEEAVKHLVDPSRLIESATEVFGKFIMEAYGLPAPVPSERVTAVGDETNLELGDGLSATVLYAPGHAPHQVALMVEREKILFTADSVGIVYPDLRSMIPTTPPPSFEPEKLLATVNLLERVGAKSLLVPHFGVRKDVLEVFEATKKKTMEWLSLVRDMRKGGTEFEAAVERMMVLAAREAGVHPDEWPVYARVSVRTTVMGMY